MAWVSDGVHYFCSRIVTESYSADVDGFLPSPFSRYTQILSATLQLLVAFGNKMNSGRLSIAKQMLSFLMSLRDVLSNSLHAAAAAPTIKRIELASLITQTLRLALPAVNDNETVGDFPKS